MELIEKLRTCKHAPAMVLCHEAASEIEKLRNDKFSAGICVALQCVTAHDDGVLWAEIVRTAGIEEMLDYAALVEPDEWELAGFRKYAKRELRRSKPILKTPNAPNSAAACSPLE
jgi:hypothetical protein